VLSTERLTDLRRRLYQATPLRAEEIEDAERQRWQVDVFVDDDDPVLEIAEKITWNDNGAIALGLTGGAGVGKTTQIFRLISHLWSEERIIGVRVGYEDYSSLSSPPDITDFLLSLAGGLAEEARKHGYLSSDWSEERLDRRFLELLRRLRFEPELVAGPVTIKAALREDESFRRRLRDHLAGQVAQLVREVRGFVSSIVNEIRKTTNDSRAVVMIVDSTERLSAPASADADMQAAVRNLFIQNGENLRFSDLHTVYLLPPWLPISDGGALRLDIVMFPTIRTSNRDDTDAESGLALLDAIVRKRMPDIDDLISPGDLRDLCRFCGGVQRVLFVLLQEVAGRARRATVLPLDRKFIKTAVDSVCQDYLAITEEATPALQRIDSTKSVDGLDEKSLTQLGRYIQALVVLQVANGEKWFTIHPLMRRRLAAVERPASSARQSLTS
jgi:hypothetical protein